MGGWLSRSKPKACDEDSKARAKGPSGGPFTSITVACALLRKYPSIVILPLLFLAVCVSIGTWAIIRAADSEVKQRRDAMINLAAAIALDMDAIMQPALTLAMSVGLVLAKGNSSAASSSALLTDMCDDVVAQMNQTGVVLGLMALPDGYGKAYIGNPIGPNLNYSTMPQRDVLADPLRRLTLHVLKQNNLTSALSGMTRLPSDEDPKRPPKIMSGFILLVVKGQPSEQMRSGMYRGVPRCPDGLCWDTARNLKTWGAMIVSLNMQVVSAQLQKRAKDAGGRFTILSPPDFLTTTSRFPVAQTNPPAPADDLSVSQVVGVPTDQWVLYVAPENGWSVAWEVPAIVGVALATLVLAGCVVAMAIYRAHYNALLESLLPKEALKQILTVAKKQGLVKLSVAVPGTTADLILQMMRTLLHQPMEGIEATDVIAVQSALHGTADIYTPMWRESKTLRILDDDVAQNLGMSLGTRALAAFAPAGHPPSEMMSMAGRPRRMSTSTSMSTSPCTADFTTLDAALSHIMRNSFSAAAGGGSMTLCTAGGVDASGGHYNRITHYSGSGSQLPYLLLAGVATSEHPLRHSLSSKAPGAVVADSCASLATANSSPQQPSLQPPRLCCGGTLPAALGTVAPTRLRVASSPQLHPRDPAATATATAPAMVACSMLHSGHEEQAYIKVERPLSVGQLEAVLSTAESFSFNAFDLHDASHGHPLACLAYYCMSSTGLTQRLNIKPSVLCKWLLCIETGYDGRNPYHNATHAADVLQTYHALLTRGGLAPGYVSNDIWHLACYMAAIVHDVGHVGCTNDFLINTEHELAMIFNDKAPLENMHVSNAWAVLNQPDNNFLKGMAKADVVQLRRTIIDLVLATDMKQHFSILGQFNAMQGVGSEVLSANMARLTANSTSSGVDRRHSPVGAGDGTCPQRGSRGSRVTNDTPSAISAACSGLPAMPINDAERLIGLQVALKCADLGHTTADLDVHRRWVSQLEEEFFRQGDEEKARQLPISPLFDRAKQGVSKSQVGFYEVVVLPLYSSLSHVFPAADPLLAGALRNFGHWKSLEQPAEPAVDAPASV